DVVLGIDGFPDDYTSHPESPRFDTPVLSAQALSTKGRRDHPRESIRGFRHENPWQACTALVPPAPSSARTSPICSRCESKVLTCSRGRPKAAERSKYLSHSRASRARATPSWPSTLCLNYQITDLAHAP